MNCAELEILICDYVDGTLARRSERPRWSATWPNARPAPNWRGIPPRRWRSWGARPKWSRRRSWSRAFCSTRRGARRKRGGRVTRVAGGNCWARFLQPQVRHGDGDDDSFAGHAGAAGGADAAAAAVGSAAGGSVGGDRGPGLRTWARSVKFYDNLKVVYQIQTTLQEWQQQDEEAPAAPPADEHRLPVSHRQRAETCRRSGGRRRVRESPEGSGKRETT